MIQISQLKLPVTHKKSDLEKKISTTLKISRSELLNWHIEKKSLDARRKPDLFYVYTITAEVSNEKRILKRIKNKNITLKSKSDSYECNPTGNQILKHRPVVIGTGPAGLFCGYELARMGYRPILLERGASIEERQKDVEEFWNTGNLNPESNVQFGEGGAGTFSDGKLNTLVHDTYHRGKEVLRLFVKYGAPESILYDAKPHIGTDILANVVKNIREAIISMGGEVRFHTKVTGIRTKRSTDFPEEPRLAMLHIEDTRTKTGEELPADVAVLAIGHSARDTFQLLNLLELHMEPKPFAVGVRIEHSQKMIDESQYGKNAPDCLPAAAYKLTAKTDEGRGVYTFCMCPGGYVVNASSEAGRLAVNGMSYSGRDGKNANSAVIVTVSPEDFPEKGILGGLAFQRQLEEAAYKEGHGKIPVQLFGDFKKNIPSTGAGAIQPQMKGSYSWGNVRAVFPEFIARSLEAGITDFGKKIPGYDQNDAVVAGVESRTSSPVRIVRGDTMESSVKGLYPCGEGAGYAGGITSAAMDGLKVAEAVSQKYRAFDTPKNV